MASDRAWSESPFFPNLRLDKDEFVADLTRLVDAVHEASAVFAQLFPSFGRMGVPRNGARMQPRAPRPVDFGSGGPARPLLRAGGSPVPDEATVEEIKGLERDVVASAPGEGGRLRRRRDRRPHVLLLLLVPLAAGEPAHRRVREDPPRTGPARCGYVAAVRAESARTSRWASG